LKGGICLSHGVQAFSYIAYHKAKHRCHRAAFRSSHSNQADAKAIELIPASAKSVAVTWKRCTAVADKEMGYRVVEVLKEVRVSMTQARRVWRSRWCSDGRRTQGSLDKPDYLEDRG
jgi:hypothetical protein